MRSPKPLSFHELLAPLRTKKKPRLTRESTAFQPWLKANGSGELVQWNEALSAMAPRAGYRNELFAAVTTSLSGALAIDDDGCRAARLRGLFLGMSPVLEDAEELWFATWAATPSKSSQVWASHQDERELTLLDDSLRNFVVRQYREDPYFSGDDPAERVVLSPELARLKVGKATSGLPRGLSPRDLEPRTDWIVALFFPEGDWYGLGDGLEGAPPFSAFAKEANLIKRWPHYQAYWLLHHLAFGNDGALRQLLPLVEASYAPAGELAKLAKAALAKGNVKLPHTSEKRLQGLRASARDARPDVFADGTKKAAGPRADGADAALASLKREAKRDAALAETLETWQALASGAGHVADLEKAFIDEWFEGQLEKQIETFMLARRGNAPALQHVLRSLASGIDARWLTLAEALVRRGAPFEDSHPLVHPGATTALVVATGDFKLGAGRITELCGPVEELGRLRRLELAVAAEELVKRGAKNAAKALQFLVGEARRFAKQIDSFDTDTAASALGFLLRQGDSAAVAFVRKMFETANFSGANWRTLMGIVTLVDRELHGPLFADALEAAFARELGRHDDGDRAYVAATFAKCAPARARRYFEERLANAATPQDSAALLAGLVTAAPADARIRKQATALLAKLKPTDEAECGAALALLRAAHEAGARGYAAEGRRWVAAKKTKYVNKELAAWLRAAKLR